MRELELCLPYPPSVNHYWKHTRQGKHYITPKGKDYQSAVFLACLAEIPFDKPVSIHLEVYLPDNRKRDLDNLWKVVLDSLSKAQIIADDCWQCVPRQSIEAVGVEKGGKLVVKIKELE